MVAINARRNVPAQWVTGQLQTIGPVLHTCSHDTDMMRWLTGASVVRVYAQTVNTLGLPHDDVAQVMYRFDSGASAIYEGAWNMPDKTPFDLDERMSVIGTDGFIHIQDTFPSIGICTREASAARTRPTGRSCTASPAARCATNGPTSPSASARARGLG